MRVVNSDVDAYIARASRWGAEMAALRQFLLDLGLTEQIKWRKPTYCHEAGNIAIMQPMKNVLGLMFFKGALIEDPDGVLRPQGEDSRSAMRVEFTSEADVEAARDALAGLVERAIAVAREGRRPEPTPEPDPVPELAAAFARDPALAQAFANLTPGRRREYHLHISSAKRPQTRADRVAKLAPRILTGKGLRDR